MKKKQFKMTRRQVLKAGVIGGAGLMMPWRFLPARAFAAAQIPGLSDPTAQPKFKNPVPDAMAPGFKFTPKKGKIKVAVGPSVQQTGLEIPLGNPLSTPVWGYGSPSQGYTWPGMTFEVQTGEPLEVKWENRLLDAAGNPLPYLITSLDGRSVVDESLHWCYSLPGYQGNSIAVNGVPIVVHLHGGHTDFQFDGNPEFFFSPGWGVRGPQWVEKKYVYDNNQPAGNLWYHDHALGLTRLNVYAGMAGFYFVRDPNGDSGLPGNSLDLPAWPYEKAYAIQDRMFKDNGELFYPAFGPSIDGGAFNDPAWDDFIVGEGATPPIPGGPSALAEFFGDHIVVNGLIWPYEAVEPRNYRLHLLNGTDSRFMAIRFRDAGIADPVNPGNGPTTIPADAPILPFHVIGSDQGLASSATLIEPNDPNVIDDSGYLLCEPGSRYDIVFDFNYLDGQRIIMENIGGDEPFGGDIPGPQIFGETDRIMAFDVVLPLDDAVPDVSPTNIDVGPNVGPPNRPKRKVALFEGKDEFGRLQPLLGTAAPASDYQGNPINWPNLLVYSSVGLTGPMEGSIAWHSPTTENPALDTTEEWEIWNVTGDAHPVHLHLVHFEILGRAEIVWDSNTIVAGDILLDGSTATEDDETRVIPNAKALSPNNNGTYLVTQPTVQHNSIAGNLTTYGQGFKIMGHTTGAVVNQPDGYVENTPKDMVTALPDQVTRIKATFDKPGRYVWHCHILSHEDHEMMRVLHVGPGA